MSPAPVTHVIFDFDGLLVDTETAYTVAHTQLLKEYGKTFTMELKRGQMGQKEDASIVWLLKQVGLEGTVDPKEYQQKFSVLLHTLFRDCKALPGAERLVRHLIAKGVPVALCTGSCSKSYPIKSEKHTAWLDLIPLKVLTGDDPEVTHGKPHPQPFQVTMKRFATQPESPAKCLVFEDSYNGVLSGLAAGMQVVMVPDENVYKPEGEFKSNVTQILESLEDFKPEDFGLTPF